MASRSPLNSLGSLKQPQISHIDLQKVSFKDIDENLNCVVCKHVAHQSWQLICGHRICENHLDDKDSIACNICNETVDKTSITPDPSGRRELLKAKIFCPNKKYGCEDITSLEQMQNHLQQCKFIPMPCKNEGCFTKIPEDMMKDHLENECDFQDITCDYCTELVKRRDIQNHRQKVCPEMEVDCTNDCGIKPMLRSKMEQHEMECPKRRQRCLYHTVGCTFEDIASEVEDHTKRKKTFHMTLMAKNVQRMEQNLMEEISLLKSDLVTKMDDLRSKKLTKEGHDALKKGQQANKKAIQDLKLLLVGYGEKNIVLSRQMEDMVSKQIVQKLESEISVLKTKTQELAEKLAVAERSAGGSQTNGLNPEQSRRYEQQIALFDTRLSELDLKFQLMETACYEGKLMWKIRDYNRRKAEALGGRTLSLFSQPFYSSRHGYKMCGRIYLNGDGYGKGTHLSFFFVMMRGEYDAILQWPFKAKVSMMLLCQDGSNQHVCNVFESDPGSNSFQKPTSEMNVASGIPEFVSHHKLETPKYLKDDTIFLMIKVDCSGLPSL